MRRFLFLIIVGTVLFFLLVPQEAQQNLLAGKKFQPATVRSVPTLRILPTYTPYPTQQPLPTYTPYPTQQPLPTYTPYPTATAPNLNGVYGPNAKLDQWMDVWFGRIMAFLTLGFIFILIHMLFKMYEYDKDLQHELRLKELEIELKKHAAPERPIRINGNNIRLVNEQITSPTGEKIHKHLIKDFILNCPERDLAVQTWLQHGWAQANIMIVLDWLQHENLITERKRGVRAEWINERPSIRQLEHIFNTGLDDRELES